MDEMDELIAYLQGVTENLYYYMGQAEETCSRETVNSQESVMLNTAWLNLENAILDLENLVQEMKNKKSGNRSQK
ncbi:hypothetical protein [Sporomusa sp.]|uniref:hypothetical protein n=1 Tax=Sporomusa sp. TaxID=2078658 RepID=UPI002C4452E2|nr:hypothetical protein [Sporomusa sp.]HWR09704.1 hypothetical protein [Sporomusa sp.]